MKNIQLPTVAIVDDDDLYRKILRYLVLKGQFGLAFEAQNGQECLQMMQQANTLPSLVVLDIEMPVMDGYQTAMEIQRRWPQVPILFHSSLNTMQERTKMLAAGTEHFLLKGDRSLSLAAMMERILEGGESREVG